ncbi:MAG: leucyl aminopeptidase family protein [Pseudobdellovibrionaceae bacterium]
MAKDQIQLPKSTFFSDCKMGQAPGKSTGFCYFFGNAQNSKLDSVLREHALPYQADEIKKSKASSLHFTGKKGPVWIYRSQANAKSEDLKIDHGGLLDDSSYASFRDHAGSFFLQFKKSHAAKLQVILVETHREQEVAIFVGIKLAQYQFRNFFMPPKEDKTATKKQVFVLKLEGVKTKKKVALDKTILEEARALGESLNICRHLVNLPPGDLNPTSYSELAKKYFQNSSTSSVTVWNANKLKQEGMGLHLAVGQGAAHPPALVHISYRPKKSVRTKPIAFVGKGITFDTGGLDIKPSSGMRLMKKDMGGSATVFALAAWAEEVGLSVPCDFYLALAENAVDQNSMRPSDVFRARNGMVVEIHNTDAEGRLVLADALDVAVTQKGKDAPEVVINVATLTGAIKVALGADLAGLFCNHDSLAEKLLEAGQRKGDLSWRMPLFKKYTGSMSSPFADFVNALDGFGGAVTAALFLEKFVGGKPWAHFDIYAWTDRAQGALGSAGGSGQGVQALSEFLRELELNPSWVP